MEPELRARRQLKGSGMGLISALSGALSTNATPKWVPDQEKRLNTARYSLSQNKQQRGQRDSIWLRHMPYMWFTQLDSQHLTPLSTIGRKPWAQGAKNDSTVHIPCMWLTQFNPQHPMLFPQNNIQESATSSYHFRLAHAFCNKVTPEWKVRSKLCVLLVLLKNKNKPKQKPWAWTVDNDQCWVWPNISSPCKNRGHWKSERNYIRCKLLRRKTM